MHPVFGQLLLIGICSCVMPLPQGVVVYYREGGLGNFGPRSRKSSTPPLDAHEKV